MNLEESHPIIPRIESEKIPLTNQIIPLVYRKKEKSSFSKTVIIITSIIFVLIIIISCIIYFLNQGDKSDIENQDYRLSIYIKKEFTKEDKKKLKELMEKIKKKAKKKKQKKKENKKILENGKEKEIKENKLLGINQEKNNTNQKYILHPKILKGIKIKNDNDNLDKKEDNEEGDNEGDNERDNN